MDYGIDMCRHEIIYNEIPDEEKGGATMCVALDQAIAQGKKEAQLEIVNSIMKNTGKGEEYACSLAGVSLQEYRKWKKA